jgi:hypothetical protein
MPWYGVEPCKHWVRSTEERRRGDATVLEWLDWPPRIRAAYPPRFTRSITPVPEDTWGLIPLAGPEPAGPSNGSTRAGHEGQLYANPRGMRGTFTRSVGGKVPFMRTACRSVSRRATGGHLRSPGGRSDRHTSCGGADRREPPRARRPRGRSAPHHPRGRPMWRRRAHRGSYPRQS